MNLVILGEGHQASGNSFRNTVDSPDFATGVCNQFWPYIRWSIVE
jgi:hypothetical protein